MNAAVLANLRDLGGTPTTLGGRVRARVLLRSAAPAHLPPDPADTLVAMLGPVDYVDLRTDREVDRDGGAGHLVARGWRWHRVPVRDVEPGPPVSARDRHLRALPRYAAAARAVFDLVDGSRPVLVACSLGKDRTGVVIAVLLHRLGVPADLLAAEYERGNAVLGDDRALLPRRWRDGDSPIEAVRGADVAAVLAADAATDADQAALDRARPFLLSTGNEFPVPVARFSDNSGGTP